MEKIALTPRQVVKAGMVPFNYDTLMKKIREGKIKVKKDAGRIYIRPEDLEEYFKSK